VLGLVVTDALFRNHPELPEGQLAKLRAAVVNMRALADVGRSLELGCFIRLGRGEEGTGGRDKSSILADTLEALIGAVYLARGLQTATALVRRLFDPLIERSARLGAGLDWKTSLQELTASLGLGVPEYVVEESGPDHAKSFRATVQVADRTYGNGAGRSKKEAEQEAAATAWEAIQAQAASTPVVPAESGRAWRVDRACRVDLACPTCRVGRVGRSRSFPPHFPSRLIRPPAHPPTEPLDAKRPDCCDGDRPRHARTAGGRDRSDAVWSPG
jgi:ribonuclease-3